MLAGSMCVLKPSRNAIVLVSDGDMFPPAVFLAKRMADLGPGDDTDIILFTDSTEGLVEARRVGLTADVRKADFTELDFGDLCPSQTLPWAAYYRICLPRLLGDDYGRILYLDIDIYPLSARIFDLFKLDLNGHPLAGSRALASVYKPKSALQAIDDKRPEKRLNSGVMLIDTDAYERQSIEAKMMQVAGTLSALNGNQEIYDRVLDGNWLDRHSPYDRCRSPRLGDFGLPSNTGRRPRRKRRSA